ncbi:hypothetical protein D3C84_429110 [compost metagenome]
MIPLTVLRRLDCVLEASKAEVLKAYNAHKLAGTAPESIEKIIQHRFKLNFFNTSNFTLKTLLDDPKQLVPNLVNSLDGFSPSARKILDKFNFKQEITIGDTILMVPSVILGSTLSVVTDRFWPIQPLPCPRAWRSGEPDASSCRYVRERISAKRPPDPLRRSAASPPPAPRADRHSVSPIVKRWSNAFGRSALPTPNDRH